jgi:ABC-type transport system substrate-binding protein
MKLNKWIALIIVSAIIIGSIGIYYYYQGLSPATPMVLRIAVATGQNNLDPHNEVGVPDKMITTPMFEGLVKHNHDMSEILPSLATSWEPVNTPGNEGWRFHLRENVRFHDGTPFNASVVKYNFERLIDPDRSSSDGLAIASAFIDSVDVEDDYTVVIRTLGAIPYFEQIAAEATQTMVSPSAIAKHGAEYFASHPVGTGPFKFVEWIPSEYIKLEKNDDYWGTKARLDEVRFEIIPEESSRYMSLLAGEIDVMSNIPPEYIDEVDAKPDMSVSVTPAMRMVWVMVNMRREPFTDIRVRQAICHAIDRDSIVENVLLNAGTPATVIFTPAVKMRLPESEVGPDGIYPYDPEESEALLTEAGWVDTNGDGIVDKDGTNLEFTFVTPLGRYLKDQEMVNVIANMLREVGIKANVEVYETASWFNAITTQNYDMTILGFGWSADVEPKIRSVFYTYGKETATWSSWSGPDAETTDDLMDMGATEMDAEQRKQYYWQAQRIILESAVFQPIYFTNNIYALYANVKNFVVMPQEYLELTECYIAEE